MQDDKKIGGLGKVFILFTSILTAGLISRKVVQSKPEETKNALGCVGTLIAGIIILVVGVAVLSLLAGIVIGLIQGFSNLIK